MLGRHVLAKELLDEKSCASELSLSWLRQRKGGASNRVLLGVNASSFLLD